MSDEVFNRADTAPDGQILDGFFVLDGFGGFVEYCKGLVWNAK